MRRLFFILLASFLHFSPVSARQSVVITAPVDGQAVQGLVAVTGASQVDGFQSAEVAFAYGGDTTRTWFVLQESQTPVLSGTLADWNTMLITDGLYSLRLRVFLADGNVLETIVTGIRVRNYTPVETPTPDASLQPAPQPLPLSTPADPPQPTALPANPAAVTPEGAYRAMARGALAIIVLFALVGLLVRLRRR